MWTKAYGHSIAAAGLAVTLLSVTTVVRADALGDDMLKPDEVDMSPDPGTNPQNHSGMFVGAGLGFGQARSTEADASPGLGYLLKVEPGFQMNRGAWGRMEVSAELMSGNLGFRTDDTNLGRVKLPVGIGLLAKVGYGYSLGNRMFGVARIGAGPISGKVEWEGADGDESTSVSGLATHIGWLMIIPMGDAFDATGGMSWTHMQLDGSDFDRPLLLNVPSVDVGIRLRL